MSARSARNRQINASIEDFFQVRHENIQQTNLLVRAVACRPRKRVAPSEPRTGCLITASNPPMQVVNAVEPQIAFRVQAVNSTLREWAQG